MSVLEETDLTQFSLLTLCVTAVSSVPGVMIETNTCIQLNLLKENGLRMCVLHRTATTHLSLPFRLCLM